MKRLLPLATLTISPLLHAQTWSCGAAGRGSLGGTALGVNSTYTFAAAGWDAQLPPQIVTREGCSSSTASFFFSDPVPEGNYDVTVVLGGDLTARTTVKAESRRIMLARIDTRAHQYVTEHFTVAVRRPEISGGGHVRLKPREIGAFDWDDKLTLEFAGNRPSVRSIQIRPAAANRPVLYLAGDSTVVDQDKEPWAAWGQMLPAFFGGGLVIANHAESGETIRSFVGEQRFAKIFSVLKPGDFLAFQFAHNDQKAGTGYVSPEMYADLLRQYIGMTRERGATPILITSMNRRTFDSDGRITDSLAPYPETMRQVAAEERVELIDLNTMSKALYEAVGEPHSRSLFVYAEPNTYPGQPEALHDDTHFDAYGAWELARCVVLGLQRNLSPLTRYLRAVQARFDPHHPDTPGNVSLPSTPFLDTQTPYGR